MEILGVEEDKGLGKILRVKFNSGDCSLTYVPLCLDFGGERFCLRNFPDGEGVAIYFQEVKNGNL